MSSNKTNSNYQQKFFSLFDMHVIKFNTTLSSKAGPHY